MHSRIIELSRKPIKPERRMEECSIPEYFYHTVCDYVNNMTDSGRLETIHWITEYLGNEVIEDADDEKMVLKPDARMKFFRMRHNEFCQRARKLSAVCLSDFSGTTPSDIGFEMYRLNHLYNDTCSFYVYDEYEDLVPLDEWIRQADVSVPYYFGGALDYHF